jgi:uncharacterized protein (DUF433 family)
MNRRKLMELEIHAETVPLRTSQDGVVYVGSTRVPLETVIEVFNEGATPEEITIQYPALSLADVYLVIGYYLQHQDEIDAYVRDTRAHSEQVRRENQARFDTTGLRERLLARRSVKS